MSNIQAAKIARYLFLCASHMTLFFGLECSASRRLIGATEIAGQENTGLENDGQKCRAGKCRTGK